MLKKKVPWDIGMVIIVHILRLVMGLIIIRGILPGLGIDNPTFIEIIDRLTIIVIIGVLLRRHKDHIATLGLVSSSWFRDSMLGISAGVGLLAVGIYSERLYTAVFFSASSQHPLIARVEAATSWQGLLIPLFLAGLLAPVVEELLYRLITYTALRDRWGIWGGALGSAGIFAMFHFNAYWLAELLIAGIGFAFLYQYTGSLLSSIVAHSVVNSAKIIMLYIGIELV